MNADIEFVQLLCDPVTGNDLSEQSDKQLCTKDRASCYPVRDGIPVILTKETPTEQDFKYTEHYQKDAEVFDYFDEDESSVEMSEVNRLRKTILTKIPADAGWVLDTGCGNGWLAHNIAGEKKKVISMDISFTNPSKSLARTPVKNHYAIVADVFALPFKKDVFDCIVASEIIEHVTDPKKFIENLLGVLRPGGKLIITTPYNEKIKYSLCIHCNQPTPQNAHLHSFTENSIRKLIPPTVQSVRTSVFNSKLLVKTRITHVFKFVPLFIWKPFDSCITRLTGKRAYRLMVEIVK